MSKCSIVLAVLLLTGAGCVNGLHSSVDLTADAAKKVAVPQRPPTVYADSITDDNAHQKALALEAEMDFDVQSDAARTPPAAAH
jgi:hypothetical protein